MKEDLEDFDFSQFNSKMLAGDIVNALVSYDIDFATKIVKVLFELDIININTKLEVDLLIAGREFSSKLNEAVVRTMTK